MADGGCLCREPNVSNLQLKFFGGERGGRGGGVLPQLAALQRWNIQHDMRVSDTCFPVSWRVIIASSKVFCIRGYARNEQQICLNVHVWAS